MFVINIEVPYCFGGRHVLNIKIYRPKLKNLVTGLIIGTAAVGSVGPVPTPKM